jgi:uncharacterized protein YdaU (DUF1376 family)
MHYYQHHIGDFIKATSRLTDSQAMAYLRLIWMYYDSEKPLPNDIDVLALQVGLPADQVELLLRAYFRLENGVWRQSRCDAELEEYRSFVSKKSLAGKASAEQRKNKRLTSAEQVLNECSTDVQLTNNHKPITNNQIKERKPVVPLELPDWLNKTDWNDFVEMRKKLKKPMTDRAVKLMISKLETMKNKGIDTSAVLQKSIVSDWIDVYEPKVQTQQNSMGRRVL